MMLMELLIGGSVFILIGVFAGLMSGVLGIGGGVIVVPGLMFLFEYHKLIPEASVMHVAAGSSLAVMILTSQSSLRAHLKLGEVLWPIFNKLWPGIVVGVVCGVIISSFISTYWLKIIFAIFLLLVATKMLADWKAIRHARFPANWINRLVSFVIGLKSGMLGVGGGVLIVPYLTYCGIDPRKIAAVSNLCTLTVALLGTTLFIVSGTKEMASIAYATGYVYWPAVVAVAIPSMLSAPLGAKLNYILPIKHLKLVFIVVLIVTALNMLRGS